ncbi:MAG: DnaA N-terminal domain-containing protein, partial [Miltoncostaeaceae bacterium]
MGASVPLIQDEARLQEVWAQVLERLRGALNAATYSLTFERAQALGFDDGRFSIGVETEFARGWIVQRYDSLVRDALFEVLGQDVAVAVEVVPPKQNDAGTVPAAAPPASAAAQAPPDAGAPGPPGADPA